MDYTLSRGGTTCAFIELKKVRIKAEFVTVVAVNQALVLAAEY